MLTQSDFVESCLIKYRFEKIPEGQSWEKAHYPLPRCLGGQETISLWSCDHTIQGLLQSEEMDYPCIHIFARSKDLANLKVFYPEYVELYEKWYLRAQSNAGSSMSLEKHREIGYLIRDKQAGIFAMTAEQKHERNVAGGRTAGRRNVELGLGPWGMSSEQRSENSRKAGLRLKELGKGFPGMSTEQRRINASKVNSKRVKCTVTGHISTPGGLSRYQKARGIDVSNRTEIKSPD
jgi:hypothetical protein